MTKIPETVTLESKRVSDRVKTKSIKKKTILEAMSKKEPSRR